MYVFEPETFTGRKDFERSFKFLIQFYICIYKFVCMYVNNNLKKWPLITKNTKCPKDKVQYVKPINFPTKVQILLTIKYKFNNSKHCTIQSKLKYL